MAGREKFVTGRVIEQSARPDKIVYRLTRKGRRELERWLGQPFVRQSGYRDDFFLKLLAASRLGEDELRETLRIQREAYLGKLSSLGELRSCHHESPLVSLLIQAALLHAEANLRLVELAENQVSELVASSQPSAARRSEEAEEATRSATATANG